MNKKYGVRYIIKLNKHVDWYNDILPLCIKLKQMVSYDLSRNIIIVYNKPFNETKYLNNPLFLDALYYSLYCKCNEELSKCKTNDIDVSI